MWGERGRRRSQSLLRLSVDEQMLVLIIEDTPDIREMYEVYLLSMGVEVLSAADGNRGLHLAREAHPDVILLDLGMPVMDGWEVANRLRGNPETTAIPIVVCTGHATGDARQRATEAGVDVFLVKPCLPADLLVEIRTVLAQSPKIGTGAPSSH